MSVSAYPSAVGLGPTQGTLALSVLFSSDFDLFSPYSSQAGVRVLTNGDVQEIFNDTWTSQNSGTEWIDEFIGSDSASNYEVQLTKTSGTSPTSGPALTSWHTISTTRQWTWTRTVVGNTQFSGTMTIREIADTSNSVSAGVSISISNGSL